MAIVQISPLTTTPSQTVSSAATTFNQAVRGGNGVVVLVATSWASAAAGPTSVADSAGNPYTLAVQKHIASSSRDVSVWYLLHAQQGGQLTVTVSAGNSLNFAVCAVEVSDLWLLGSTNSATGTSATPTPGSVTPVTPDELMFAVIENGEDGIAAPSGFTNIWSDPFIDGEAAYYEATGFPGATTPTWSTSNLEYAACVATFVTKAPVPRSPVRSFLPIPGVPALAWMLGPKTFDYTPPRSDTTSPQIGQVVFGPPRVGTPWFFLNRPRPVIAPDVYPEMSPPVYARPVTEGPPCRVPAIDRRRVSPLPVPESGPAPGPSAPNYAQPFRRSPFPLAALLTTFPTPLPVPPPAPADVLPNTPGKGKNRPMVSRVPQLDGADRERRMARTTEKLASIINSLIEKGILRQTKPGEWEIVLEE